MERPQREVQIRSERPAGYYQYHPNEIRQGNLV